MLFSKQITIAKNTSEANASQTEIKVSKGVITNIWINFPSGCAGLVKLRVYHEGHPFLPVNADNYIRGNNYTFKFPIMYEITEEPMTLKVELWNDDDTFEHTIDVLILILPRKVVMPIGATEGILESLKSLVIRPLVIKQEAEEGET